MRVERIELIGFKSFAEKTVFNLHPGSTAIVGPNGCGKSNVIDAFKWVLGEQSAKSLRGGSMEDVIFAGSSTKKTKGMAEVTLILSDILDGSSNVDESDDSGDNGSNGNGNGNGNGDRSGGGKIEKKGTDTISVTRRLYRSGESAYLMNKVPCRLKDIKNMFLDTGLDVKAYSILEQGKIGDIINSKPQDRRFLIEEVAGVVKYKVRKHEAQNKLELSKSNLQRLQDIIAEVKRQINTIDRHARKAERYKKLFEEVKDIELRIARRDINALRKEVSELATSEADLKSSEAEVSAGVHSTEALIEEKKRLCVENEKILSDIRARLYAVEKEATEDEGKIALRKNECENLMERSVAIAKQREELERDKESASHTMKDVEYRALAMEREIVRLDSILQEKNGIFTEVEREILDRENNIESRRKDLFSKAEEISNTKNEINHLNISIENLSHKSEKNSSDLSDLHQSLNTLNNEIAQGSEELVSAEKKLEESRTERESLSEKLNDRKAALSSNEENLYRDREEFAGMCSKLESLKEMDRSRLNSVDEGIKTLCQVADVFETGREYETAIEAILGDRLGAAVVDDNKEIKKALQHIKERKTTRSGFINISPAIGKHNLGQAASFDGREGVIGLASNLVSVKEGFDKIAISLLSDVVVVDSLDTAFSLRERSSEQESSVCFVTADGEVLDPKGMVFGGSDREILKIKREIKELEGEIVKKKEKISVAEQLVADLKNEIISVENRLISINGKISSHERYSHELHVRVTGMKEENERMKKKQEYIAIEIDGDHKEKDRLKNDLAGKEGRCRDSENEKEGIENNIREIQGVITDKKEMLETMRSELTSVRLDLTSTREQMTSIGREKERLSGEISGIDLKNKEMLDELNGIKVSITEKESEIVSKEEDLKNKIVEAGELQAEASRTGEKLEAKNAELQLIEKKQKELTADLDSVRSELGHVEMKKMEQSMKLDYIREDINKTYSVDIDKEEISEVIEPEEEEKLSNIKDKLKGIGPVSLGTIDEYEELKKRYEFLTEQRDDLLKSIDALEDTIRKINRTSKERLEEAFELLNAKFKEVFSILFGKGRAELQLTEGSILDAGIEIIAQPPGKRLQNMMLLSGGEKALTALSLLFAGFMIKPTPMCLLDEVDAPLDESNTDRFVGLLKKLAETIQFITITHNRRTMESADYIYGVTMEEPGSSKVISMHLAEETA